MSSSRIRVAGIAIADSALLIQYAVDDPAGGFALPGGRYEVGDTLESRLRIELAEETNARVIDAVYLFCVENRFHWRGKYVDQVEHYFRISLDRQDVESREAHLRFRWVPLSELAGLDLRPTVVRDAIVDGTVLA